MQSNNPLKWNIWKLWNESITAVPRRPMVPRDYIYASEISMPVEDVYLKMLATPPTNPPNVRALRKMACGLWWEETYRIWMMKIGLLESAQIAVKSKQTDILACSGRIDFTSKDHFDLDSAERAVAELGFSDIFGVAAHQVIDHFRANYSHLKLQKTIVEVKSCSSFVYDRNAALNAPSEHHAYQCWFYCHSLQMPGKILYISRDDARLLEFEIDPEDRRLMHGYREYMEKITDAYMTKIIPEPQPPVYFNEDECRFSKRWTTEFSPYLTRWTGLPDQAAFYAKYTPIVSSLNRVYKRFVTDQTITKKNLEVVESSGYAKDWDRLVMLGKVSGVHLEEEELETAEN